MITKKKKATRRRPVAVVGWNEYVDLPGWGIRGLRAKIDTGARTSALHVDNVEELPGQRVRFDVVLDRDRGHKRSWIVAEISRRGRVRSSTGKLRTRLFVKTVVRLGPIERDIELSLVDREKMVYRMLIGRTALGGRFLIDTGSQCLHGQPPGTVRKKRRTRS